MPQQSLLLLETCPPGLHIAGIAELLLAQTPCKDHQAQEAHKHHGSLATYEEDNCSDIGRTYGYVRVLPLSKVVHLSGKDTHAPWTTLDRGKYPHKSVPFNKNKLAQGPL